MLPEPACWARGDGMEVLARRPKSRPSQKRVEDEWAVDSLDKVREGSD